jgi:hypothetical protein
VLESRPDVLVPELLARPVDVGGRSEGQRRERVGT